MGGKIKDDQNNISLLKRKNNFSGIFYLIILRDLDDLFKEEKCNIYRNFDKETKLKKEIISNERNNFRKFLIYKFLDIIKKQKDAQKYESSIEYIKKLENILNSTETLDIISKIQINNEIQTIKNFCKLKINCNKGLILLKNKKYEESISLFQEFLLNSKNDNYEYKHLKICLDNAKTEFINEETRKNINLIKLNKFKEVIINFENINNKYKNESSLEKPLNEAKIPYGFALKKIIEEKNKLNENWEEEEKKYVILPENIKNKLEIFYKNYKKSDTKIQNEKINSNIIKNEHNEISLNVIKIYLEKIKSLNKEGINKELENDLISQVNNFNEESKKFIKNNEKIENWFKKNKKNIEKNNFRGNIFAVFNIINKNIINYDIRPIQLLSILFLSQKKNSSNSGLFLQINTGEGKSLIIQFFAAYLALLGKKVDIISSNTVLANRDAEDKNKISFYSQLNLTVGCASKDEYYKDIIYGDTQNFEAGILREEFKNKKIRNNRTFDCIIVDEVDSISLDNIITMTQLTENFPGRSCFYSFYYQILIWYCYYISELLKKNTGKTQEYYLQNPDEFKDEIKKDIQNKLKKSFLNENGKILTYDNKNFPIIYPNSMKNYIENSFDIWIDNVMKASTMVEFRDFIKKMDNIVPVDYLNTGVLQNNMVWEGGLQQYLQIIHNEKGTFENESTNFLSNVSFFKRYNGNIFGVTGTFGGAGFQKILREVYKVNLFKIPPNKDSLLKDFGGKICSDEKEYNDEILKNIEEILTKKRSVLLICYSIVEAQNFYEILNKIYGKKVMKYFTEDDNKTIEKILEVGEIIVATNLAGRGTDIKISDELEENGGLHVLVSFFPLNQRIEEQNYGRAGRKGQKGSYILIFLYNNEYGYLNEDEINFDSIKKKREEFELKNINSLINNELVFIEKKEELFKEFCGYLKENYKTNENNVFEKKSFEEQWGIILKENNIENIKQKYFHLTKNNVHSIENNLIKIHKIIKELDNSNKFDQQIISDEPFYSWAARIRYANLLAIENFNGEDKIKKMKKAIEEYKNVKKIIDNFIADLSSQSAMNKIVFSFFVKNQKLIEKKDFKTKIEMQNEIRKNFLEILKSLI